MRNLRDLKSTTLVLSYDVPDPDPEFYFRIRIRPDPYQHSFFKLESGRNRIRIFLNKDSARTGPGYFF